MSAYDYCRDKVALPGSSLYYSVLFVDPALRTSLTALHALAEEFCQVVDECSDEGVARAKLGWWAEEMQRACTGKARHPVAQLLAKPLQQAGVEAERFVHVLAALNTQISRRQFQSFAELEAHYECLADISGCMAAEFCGFRDPGTLIAARAFGAGRLLAELARRPNNKGVHRGTDLPRETLTAFGASEADLDAERSTAALKKCIASVVEPGRARLEASLQQMPEMDHRAQCSRRALAAMELAQLRAIERSDFAVLERPRAVTPLRKLWIAWKYCR
jgi:phytoene synthase